MLYLYNGACSTDELAREKKGDKRAIDAPLIHGNKLKRPQPSKLLVAKIE